MKCKYCFWTKKQRSGSISRGGRATRVDRVRRYSKTTSKSNITNCNKFFKNI